MKFKRLFAAALSLCLLLAQKDLMARFDIQAILCFGSPLIARSTAHRAPRWSASATPPTRSPMRAAPT